MNNNIIIILEAIFVGLITIIVGYLSKYIIHKYYIMEENLAEVCKNWNKNYVMEKSLFLTGFLIHIICQYTGVNHWYCNNGIACKTT